MRDRRRASVSRDRRQHDWQDLAASEQAPQGERVLIARARLAEADAVLAGLGLSAERVAALRAAGVV